MIGLYVPPKFDFAFGDRIQFNGINAHQEEIFTTAQKIANFCEELLAQTEVEFSASPSLLNPKEVVLYRQLSPLESHLSHAGKVALICTLILPLFALIYKAIYREITCGLFWTKSP